MAERRYHRGVRTARFANRGLGHTEVQNRSEVIGGVGESSRLCQFVHRLVVLSAAGVDHGRQRAQHRTVNAPGVTLGGLQRHPEVAGGALPVAQEVLAPDEVDLSAEPLEMSDRQIAAAAGDGEIGAGIVEVAEHAPQNPSLGQGGQLISEVILWLAGKLGQAVQALAGVDGQRRAGCFDGASGALQRRAGVSGQC